MHNCVVTDIDPASWIGEFAATLVKPSEMDAVVRRLNDEIAVELPQFRTDLELRRALDASTTGQLRAFTASLLVEAGAIRPAPEAVYLASTIARRGLDLSVLLRIYRHGQQAALRFMNDVIETQGFPEQGRTDALMQVWSRASSWFSLCVEQLITVYAEEREGWLRSALTRRTLQVDTILRGDPIEVATAEAVLGHRLRRRQTALVISANDDAEGTTPLEALAARLGTALGAPRPLLVPVGSRTVWAWLATDHDPDLLLLSTTTLLDDGIRIGIGIPADGIGGFRSSHREAVAALEAGNGQVVLYSDVELVSLLSTNRAALGTFVARELGPLADDANATVRETVLAYLSAGVGGAPARLGVHRNTVRYRLQQAEVILGHSVESRRLELHLALLCAATAATSRE